MEKTMTNNLFKIGDLVRIAVGPADKVGKIGRISTLVVNGAIIVFEDGSGTGVKFAHLEKVIEEDNQCED